MRQPRAVHLSGRWLRAAFAAAAAAVMGLAPLPARAADDPALGSQWGLARIRAESAWARTTGAGVRIGIVDTGVDLGHEDLAGKVVAAASCVGSAGRPAACGGSVQDSDGHGTHVAGIVAAIRGNGKGGAGVAPGAALVVAKVFSPGRVATTADVVAGIEWVVDHGARVVNLGLGDSDMVFVPGPGGPGLRAGLDYAWVRGAVPVLAAGRYGRLGVDLDDPASHGLHAIVVGATGPDNTEARYSTPTGAANLAVLAPGGGDNGPGVFSSDWVQRRANTYAFRSGTAMAAAHVAGAVALLLAEGYNGRGAVERLLSTADGTVPCDMGSPSCYGLIDVDRATQAPVEQARS
jgi:subtilisin family serine protease